MKYRKDLFLSQKYVDCIKEILQGIERTYYIQTETIGFDEGHVHLLLCAAPRYPPSKVISVVKSLTAIELFKRFPDIRKELWDGEFWSDGGYIGTVGEGANVDTIRTYIKKQGGKGEQLCLVDFTTEP